MSAKPPVEGKVYSATIGSGIGVVMTPFILWLLGVTIWDVPIDAGAEFAAVAAVPTAVAAPIGVLVLMGSTFLGGYLAKHTPRPEITEALEETKEKEEALDEDLPDEDAVGEDADDDELGADTDSAPEVEVQDPDAEPIIVNPQPSV